MARLLEDRVAIVTGASSGIGRAAAMVFARHGARVVAAGRRSKLCEETAALVHQEGGQALAVPCDVSQAAEVEALVQRTVARFGRLDCAFNNAGLQEPVRRLHEQPPDEWARTVDTNLRGTWLCMKYELAQLVAQGRGGAIVNGASTAGLFGVPGSAIYTASKHGVVGLTKAAALEYAKDDIRINAICPGITRTPLIEGIIGGREKVENYLTAYSALGRMAAPEEIAEAAAWLCSDAASFVTGIAMPVDAGQVAGERPNGK
jgi:NAD(P)-dependent dehydrogenase (short-subunit alcohol dehydrogenase family)